MSYEWQQDYEPGQVKMACGICGASYRFPAEIVYCDDRVMRCKRTCMEPTIQARDQKIAASHGRREAVPPPFGSKASWETPTTPTFDCTGGSIDGTAHTITLPAALFDDSIVWRSLVLAGTGDMTNDGSHTISRVTDRHTLLLAGALNDQALTAAMTATVT